MEYTILLDEKERNLLLSFNRKFLHLYNVRVFEVGKQDGKFKFFCFGGQTALFHYFVKFGRWCLAKELDDLNIHTKSNELI